MIYIILLLVTAGILIYTGMPLLREQYWPFVNLSKLREITEEKRTGIWAITDIENEFQMGKLSEEDYNMLMEQFRSEILPVLKREQELLGKSPGTSGENGNLSEGVRQRVLLEVLRICGKRLSS
jgi:hypothetical protein